MKNYDELTDNLLKRRDCYVTEQKKKKKTAINVTASMCCLCFVALLGFGIWHSGMIETVSPDTSEGSVITGIPIVKTHYSRQQILMVKRSIIQAILSKRIKPQMIMKYVFRKSENCQLFRKKCLLLL